MEVVVEEAVWAMPVRLPERKEEKLESKGNVETRSSSLLDWQAWIGLA